VREAIAEAIGEAALQAGDWLIVDQFDVGPRMLPEQLSLAGLRRLTRRA